MFMNVKFVLSLTPLSLYLSLFQKISEGKKRGKKQSMKSTLWSRFFFFFDRLRSREQKLLHMETSFIFLTLRLFII